MITQTVTVKEKETQNIIVGRRGTYGTEEIVFDLSYLIESYGDGSAVLMVKRPVDQTAYPAVTTREGNNLIWEVGDVDTSFKGHGECELFWTSENALAKSVIYSITVLRDIGETTETPPDPYETWIDDLTELGAETLENARAAAQSASDAEIAKVAAVEAQEEAESASQAIQDMSVSAQSLAPGQPASVEKEIDPETGAVSLLFNIPAGDEGASYVIEASAGAIVKNNNANTFSPTTLTLNAYVIRNGVRTNYVASTIGALIWGAGMTPSYSANNTNTFTFTIPFVTDTGRIECYFTGPRGRLAELYIPVVVDGMNGTDGQDGQDGYSPSASVSQSGTVTTITITDKTGTTSESIDLDGFQPAPSTMGTAGQVLGLDSNLNPAWVDQTGGGGTSDYGDLTNKPKINSVTLSGNKSLADLGIAATSDIPDVSGFYTKPSGGIPASDLASAVQTSLGKADTALQSAPVTSVNSKTGAVTLSASDVGALPDSYTAPVTSVNSKTGAVTLTAFDVGAGTYSKPSGGIPASDMSSAVQTSLGKADTALQSAPVTSVNSKTGAVTLTASDVGAGTYSKPSGGIPASDLSSAVQTSLGKADTALQSAPVTSVNTKTGAVTLSASDVGALPDSYTAPVTSVNSKTGAVTLTASDVGAGTYSKPSGGIPASDLASAVQTSLGKADTALQSAPVTSVNNKTGAVSLSASDVSALPSDTTYVSAVNGQSGAVTVTVPTKTSDLTNDSNFITGMTILSYGSSTWQNFLDAFNANKVVYCKASSNSNPATGTQGRMAFMAFVNFSGTTPISVEFQYYRSVSSHTDAQQGDQVFIYKLESNGTWSVTTREAYTKIAAGTGLSGSYSNGTLTLSNSQTPLPTITSTDNGKVLTVSNGAWSAENVPTELPAVTSSDNGKFLCVDNGAWSAVQVPNAQGVSF